jgi:hypothetical protein
MGLNKKLIKKERTVLRLLWIEDCKLFYYYFNYTKNTLFLYLGVLCKKL